MRNDDKQGLSDVMTLVLTGPDGLPKTVVETFSCPEPYLITEETTKND